MVVELPQMEAQVNGQMGQKIRGPYSPLRDQQRVRRQKLLRANAIHCPVEIRNRCV